MPASVPFTKAVSHAMDLYRDRARIKLPEEREHIVRSILPRIYRGEIDLNFGPMIEQAIKAEEKKRRAATNLRTGKPTDMIPVRRNLQVQKRFLTLEDMEGYLSLRRVSLEKDIKSYQLDENYVEAYRDRMTPASVLGDYL